MLKSSTALLTDKPSDNVKEVKLIRFLTVLCIYLFVVVIAQLVIILLLNNSGYYQTESLQLICPAKEEGGHVIAKRQVSDNYWNWKQINHCPIGCVRKRRRKIPIGVTRLETDSGNNNGYVQSFRNVGAPQGERGNQGERGLPGLPGSMGPSGSVGSQGVQGPPGPMGAIGAPGLPGMSGGSGSRGERGPQGAPGIQGPAGQRGSSGQSSSSYELRSGGVGRGDQGHYYEDHNMAKLNKTSASELLREFRLYPHPECKDEVNHRELMNTLKDTGKTSFMILIDLQDNKYCIVHS